MSAPSVAVANAPGARTRIGAGPVRRYRALHPGAWWLWALALAVACARTTNPLLLGLAIVVAGFVVVSCRTNAPWGRAYGAFLRLGAILVTFTLLLRLLLGPGETGGVLVRLPAVPLPSWLAGLHIGGAVSSGAVVSAAYQSLQIAAVFACIGAANALVSPIRLLKSMPAALYEAGLVVTVAMTFAPQAVATAGRLRTARRLRGRPSTGIAALRGIAVPLLEGGLDHSLALAAAMDSRGYGRRATTSAARTRASAAVSLLGLVAVALAGFGLFDDASPTVLRYPVLGLGVTLLAGGLLLTGRRSTRSRYRPDRFDARSLAVAASGIAAAVGVSLSHGLQPQSQPPVAPPLPLLATAALLVALLPAVVARSPRGANP